MTRTFLLLLGLASVAPSQPRLAIDLSGEWRAALDPDPSFARPDLDDAAWPTVTLPPGRGLAPRSEQPAWLRKTVDLPPGANVHDLVLTLGALRERYAVYVNGHHLATVGSFASHSATQLRRPRVFPVPAHVLEVENGRRVSIALRLGSPPASPFSLWMVPDEGPYLLSHKSLARESAAVAALALHRQRYTPVLLLGVVYLVLAIPVLLAWFSERQRRDLLLFALLLLAHAFNGAYTVLAISADAQPWNPQGGRTLSQLAVHSTYLLLSAFVLEALGFRSFWPHGLIWMSGLALFARDAGLLDHLPLWVGSGLGHALLAGCAIAVGWHRLIRSGAPLRRHLFVAALAVRILARGISATRIMELRQIYFQWGGYYFREEDVTTLVLTLGVFGMLFWEVAAERADRQRLAGEFEAARVVQRLLLPESSSKGAVITEAVYEPAREVGDDFYQIAERDNGSKLILVGDVSGKGLEAAMMASVAVGAFRYSTSDSPAELLEGLNRALCGHGRTGFVTCCCARFDADGRVTVANAGHPPPYCDGQEVAVEAGLPLGIVPGATYEETAVSGECFTFVSDGVVEAENSQRELFGFERTRAISTKSASEIAEAAKAWGQNDDITVVTVRRAMA